MCVCVGVCVCCVCCVCVCMSVLGISRSILISRPVSRSARLDLVLDPEGVGLDPDLDLGASDLGNFSRECSRSTLLLRKISYEKAFKIVHQSAKTRLHAWNGYYVHYKQCYIKQCYLNNIKLTSFCPLYMIVSSFANMICNCTNTFMQCFKMERK